MTAVGLRKLDHRWNQRSLISGLCCASVPAAATAGASTIAVVTAARKKVCMSL
jgi:hypothetical protein